MVCSQKCSDPSPRLTDHCLLNLNWLFFSTKHLTENDTNIDRLCLCIAIVTVCTQLKALGELMCLAVPCLENDIILLCISGVNLGQGKLLNGCVPDGVNLIHVACYLSTVHNLGELMCLSVPCLENDIILLCISGVNLGQGKLLNCCMHDGVNLIQPLDLCAGRCVRLSAGGLVLRRPNGFHHRLLAVHRTGLGLR